VKSVICQLSRELARPYGGISLVQTYLQVARIEELDVDLFQGELSRKACVLVIRFKVGLKPCILVKGRSVEHL
jgi:hypothetical protein